jgi:hypothetical protein
MINLKKVNNLKEVNEKLREHFSYRFDGGIVLSFGLVSTYVFSKMLIDNHEMIPWIINDIMLLDIVQTYPNFEFKKVSVTSVWADTKNHCSNCHLRVFLKFNKIDATLIKLTK